MLLTQSLFGGLFPWTRETMRREAVADDIELPRNKHLNWKS
uniref:Uncharacterized protein n=1 Tax=Gorilla gorilla gorilla TaxID=9595 RepID=A0A2I2YKP7_GORGO